MSRKPSSTSLTDHTDNDEKIDAPSSGEEVLSHETTIPSQGESMPAFLAKPRESNHQPLPIMLVIHDKGSVDQPLRDLCQQLAAEGYFVVAPELFFRDQEQEESVDDNHTLIANLSDNQVLSDLDHAAHWAMKQGGDIRRLSVMGFGWGGRISWLYAAHTPQIKAAVSWYGPLTHPHTLKQSTQPIDITSHLVSPVLGLYGAKDTSVTLEDIGLMRQALHSSNARGEIIVYPDADGQFNWPENRHYHQESASEAWKYMLAWLAQQKVA